MGPASRMPEVPAGDDRIPARRLELRRRAHGPAGAFPPERRPHASLNFFVPMRSAVPTMHAANPACPSRDPVHARPPPRVSGPPQIVPAVRSLSRSGRVCGGETSASRPDVKSIDSVWRDRVVRFIRIRSAPPGRATDVAARSTKPRCLRAMSRVELALCHFAGRPKWHGFRFPARHDGSSSEPEAVLPARHDVGGHCSRCPAGKAAHWIGSGHGHCMADGRIRTAGLRRAVHG